MEYIERKNGYVYIVREDSADGRFKTYQKMGKDLESPMWADEVKEMSNKRKRQKKEGKK